MRQCQKEGKLCEEWLRALRLFSLEETEGKPHWGLQLPREGKKRDREEEEGQTVFSVVTSDRTEDNGLKLCQSGFSMD